MTRYVLTVNLKNDPAAIEAYRDYHRRVWPEVLQSLRDVGVEAMDIYLLGRRAVMIVEMTDGLDYRRAFAAHASSNPRVAEWERLMKSLQEPSPDGEAAESTARRFAVPQVFGSLDEAARFAGVIFDVAVPGDQIHGVLQRLPQGAAVLIQKPMGEHLAAARRILAVCRERKLIAAMNF